MNVFMSGLVLAASLALPLQARPISPLSTAFDAAWQRSAAGAAAAGRADEAQARREVGRRWLRESPSVSASYRSDQIDRNQGAREIELELGVPLALPAERRHNIGVADAEADALAAVIAAQKLALAHEVREAFWTAQLAQIEVEVARRRLEEATQLAADVDRRLKVGEVARVDAMQARSAQLTAATALRSAEREAQMARQAFRLLTGLDALAAGSEAPATVSPPIDAHPQLAAARRQAEAARARAEQASAIRRDTPEFNVTLTRDRGEFAAPTSHTLRVGVRVPLGSDARNAVRIAQTGAERTEAEVAALRERERIEAGQALARDQMAAARAAAADAAERLRLAADAQQLIGRAYALGERDLASRLRADTERHEAELAAARAQAELGRAVSRFNQALGVLP